MQTFMPYPTFEQSLACLDDKRLGKQRVECRQILSALLEDRAGWRAHPATRMWRGAVPALIEYTLTACELWRARGFRDTVQDYILTTYHDIILSTTPITPSWCRDSRVLDSHKAMLYHKNPQHYKQFAAFSSITQYHWPC